MEKFNLRKNNFGPRSLEEIREDMNRVKYPKLHKLNNQNNNQNNNPNDRIREKISNLNRLRNRKWK